MHSAEGDLANAKAGLEFAKVDARRAEDLFGSKLISQSDYDKAIATLHQSEAQVKIKEASLENAKINLARCTIYSPVDGTVISRNVDIGQTVAASMSAPVLFQVANDLTKMQIDANVSEADIGTIKEGQTVNFTVDAFPDRKFIGKVRQIRNAPTTVQNVVTYDAVIDVNNPEGETPARHDRQRFHHHGATFRRAENSQRRPAVPSARAADQPDFLCAAFGEVQRRRNKVLRDQRSGRPGQATRTRPRLPRTARRRSLATNRPRNSCAACAKCAIGARNCRRPSARK